MYKAIFMGIHLLNLYLFLVLAAAILLVVALVLLTHTWVVPAAGMIIFSLALASGTVSVISSAPLLLPHELAGTGMGLHKCANNIGTTIVAILVGYVQDLTYHDGNPYDDQSDLTNEYNGVMTLYIVMACCSTLVVVIFIFMDYKLLGGWLQADKKERDRRLEVARREQEEEDRARRYPYYGVDLREQVERRDKALQMIGSRMRHTKTYRYLSFYAFWLLVSWVVFFTFALMPIYQRYSMNSVPTNDE